LTTAEPGYEFADAFSLKVPYKAIRFDLGNDRRKTHIELVSRLIRRLQDFEEREIPKHAQAMRDWRKNCRDWELKLVVHEFKERKNMQIFKSEKVARTTRARTRRIHPPRHIRAGEGAMYFNCNISR
jgi:hypothetical protein